jgi:hypothetical protein
MLIERVSFDELYLADVNEKLVARSNVRTPLMKGIAYR